MRFADLLTDSSIHFPSFFLQPDPIPRTVSFPPSPNHLQFAAAAANFEAWLQTLAYCVLVRYHWFTGNAVQSYGEQGLVENVFLQYIKYKTMRTTNVPCVEEVS